MFINSRHAGNPRAVPRIFGSAWRLFGTLALILAVLIGALTGVVVSQARRSLEREAVRQNTLIAGLVARSVEAQFDGLIRYVDSFARRPLFVGGVEDRAPDRVGEHLRELVTRNQRLDRAFVTDPRGTLWADYPHAPEVIGQNFSFRDWYLGASAGQVTYVSEVYQRAAPPKLPLVAIATRIRNADQATVGYLVTQYTVEALAAWLTEVRPSAAGSVALVDHHGGLAVTERRGNDGPLDLSRDPLVRAALAGATGSAVAGDPMTGEQSLISYTPVPTIGWAVLSRQPMTAVFGPAAALQRTIGMLSLTFFAIMLGVGFVWLNTVRRQQHALRTVHAQIESVNRSLAAANEELEAFSYSVAHDLRAPLRAIDGFSKLVVEEHAPHLPPEGRRYLNLVGESAQQMGRLIDDLLTFSRMARHPLNRQRVDTTRLVAQVAADLQQDETTRNTTITIGELPECVADPSLLRQVFVNLLSNAVKFSRSRGAPRIEVAAQTDGAEPVYLVRDNGVGFDMRYADKLFRVFQRLHRAEEYEGTGVGLAIVQRVVHRHGGRVWAAAEVDRGATFYFTLGGRP